MLVANWCNSFKVAGVFLLKVTGGMLLEIAWATVVLF